MLGSKKKNRKIRQHIFLKIWIRTGLPILAVTIVVLYLFLNFFLISIEVMKGHRVETIQADLTAILSNTDLTDKGAVEKELDLSAFHMAAVLFDPNGREIARSNLCEYTEREDEARIARYQALIDTMLELHAGKDMVNNQVNAFDYNEWYAMGPIYTAQGMYALYCASETAVWIEDKEKLLAIGLGVLAGMTILTLLITWSCYRIHTRQQALEADYRRKVNALAHNLKTPMMVLCGYSENLLAEIQAGKSVHYAEKIVENVNLMNAMVDEVLEFTVKSERSPS